MKYYLLKNTKTGKFLKGTKNRWYNSPPKLYSYGCARQVQSFYANCYPKIGQLEIVPVNISFDS